MYLVSPPLLCLGYALSRGVPERATRSYCALCTVGVLVCIASRTLEVYNRIATASFYGQANYTQTVQRCAPYFAGVMAAVAVDQHSSAPYRFAVDQHSSAPYRFAVDQHSSAPYRFAGPRMRSLLWFAACATLLTNALVGAAPLYFLASRYGPAYRVR